MPWRRIRIRRRWQFLVASAMLVAAVIFMVVFSALSGEEQAPSEDLPNEEEAMPQEVFLPGGGVPAEGAGPEEGRPPEE